MDLEHYAEPLLERVRSCTEKKSNRSGSRDGVSVRSALHGLEFCVFEAAKKSEWGGRSYPSSPPAQYFTTSCLEQSWYKVEKEQRYW
jgi:hypothetical protein